MVVLSSSQRQQRAKGTPNKIKKCIVLALTCLSYFMLYQQNNFYSLWLSNVSATKNNPYHRMIVTTVSSALFNFSKNAFASLDFLAPTETINVRIVALSPRLCEEYPAYQYLNLNCTYAAAKVDTDRDSNVEYHSKSYIANVVKKMAGYLQVMNEIPVGNVVLFSDVDVVFLKDPFVNFLQQTDISGNYEMWFQDEETMECSMQHICTGFYFVKVSPQTRRVFAQTMYHLKRKETYDRGDQGAMYQALQTHTGIHGFLSCRDYPTGNSAFLSPPLSNRTTTPVALHANWMKHSAQKLSCMKAAGVWYEDVGAFSNYAPDPNCAPRIVTSYN